MEVVDLVSLDDDSVDLVVDIHNHTFVYCSTKAPDSKPSATFVAFKNKTTGAIIRRVYNKKSGPIKDTRANIAHWLQSEFGIKPEELPLFKTEPVELKLRFHRKHPNWRKMNKEWQQHPFLNADVTELKEDTKKPDLDNLVKFVCDALTGVVYADDRQVVKTLSSKFVDQKYPFTGRTTIIFNEYSINSDEDVSVYSC